MTEKSNIFKIIEQRRKNIHPFRQWHQQSTFESLIYGSPSIITTRLGNFYDEGDYKQGPNQQKDLIGHTGCVNTLSFNDRGDRICTGSDDSSVKIWDTFSKKCLCTLYGHVSNVFASSFLEQYPSLLVTGGNDSDVRLWDLEKQTAKVFQHHHKKVLKIVTNPKNYPHSVFSCSADGSIRHFDIRMNYDNVQNQSNIFSPTADTDTISSYANRRVIPQAFGGGVGERTRFAASKRVKYSESMLIRFKPNGSNPSSHFRTVQCLYSLDVSPNGNDIICGAEDGNIYLFDLRKLFSGGNGNYENNLYNHNNYATNHHFSRIFRNVEIKPTRDVPCTGCEFNYDGKEIIGTYLGENIYLFNSQINFLQNYELSRFLGKKRAEEFYEKKKKKKGKLETENKEGNETSSSKTEKKEENEGSSTKTEKKEEKQEIRSTTTSPPSQQPEGAHQNEENEEGAHLPGSGGSRREGIVISIQDLFQMISSPGSLQEAPSDEEGEEEDEEDSEYEENEEITQDVVLNQLPESSSYSKKFKGHISEKTIKGAYFVGKNSEYIISGSDEGNVFIWDKKTGDIVNVLEGHESVINSIAVHPKMPLIATAGIDDYVKIWSPDDCGTITDSAIKNTIEEIRERFESSENPEDLELELENERFEKTGNSGIEFSRKDYFINLEKKRMEMKKKRILDAIKQNHDYREGRTSSRGLQGLFDLAGNEEDEDEEEGEEGESHGENSENREGNEEETEGGEVDDRLLNLLLLNLLMRRGGRSGG